MWGSQHAYNIGVVLYLAIRNGQASPLQDITNIEDKGLFPMYGS